MACRPPSKKPVVVMFCFIWLVEIGRWALNYPTKQNAPVFIVSSGFLSVCALVLAVFFALRYHRAFAFLGPWQIVSIILRATGGLEKRQAEKYGSSKEWKEYAASTPVLVPGSRQYTWGKAEKKK